MANKAKFQIDVVDFSQISEGDLISIYVKDSNNNEYFLDLIGSEEIGDINFLPNGTNFDTAESIENVINYCYGPSGVIFQLPFSTTVANLSSDIWSVIVEFDDYGFPLLEDNFSQILGVNILFIQEVITPIFAQFNYPLPAESNPILSHVKHTFGVGGDPVFPLQLRYGNAGNKTCNSASDFFFDYPRFTAAPSSALSRTIEITETSSGRTAVATIPNVSTFAHGGINVMNSESTGQATINANITNVGDVGLTFTYEVAELIGGIPQTSISQASNIFENLPIGQYRSTIIDQFGAFVVEDLEVVGGVQVTKPEPYMLIPNANSLKYYAAGQPLFDDKRFSEQSDRYINVEMQDYYQRMKTTDLITTQIKTSYDDISVSVRNCNGEEVLTPSVALKKKHIGLQDKRDCTVKKTDDGLGFYIYFEGGNTYDVGTTDVAGTYTPVGASLPSFQRVGNFIELSGPVTGLFEVEEIIYNTDISRWVLKCSGILPISAVTYARCETTYNAEDWNVMEFDIPFNLLPEGNYYVEMLATDEDPRYNDRLWASEPIALKTNWENNRVVEFSNLEPSNSMDWTTGIVSKLNIEGRAIRWDPKIKSERFSSDDDATETLKSVVNDVVVLETGLLPQYVAKKLVIAAGCDSLIVDGTEFDVPEDPEIFQKISDNNPFYHLNIKLQQKGNESVGDSVGLVSAAASVFGVGESDVYGL